MKKTITALALAFLALSANAQTNASWVSSDNDIDFLSIKITQKKRSVTETSNFGSSQATLDAQGDFKLDIDLNSVKTNIDLRDQRLRDWVFETAKFGKATITGKVDAEKINKLAVGQAIQLEQPLKLDLHGQQTDIDAVLNVHRVAEDKIQVNTLTPVLLDTKDMGLETGVARLVQVMGLLSIVDQVPVNFSGEFVRQP
ncbi:MAG: YceI family protein [Lautropia sp.]|nr:YceI family protein [Lautropia sp.]